MEFTGERFIPDLKKDDIELSVEHYHRYLSVLPFIKGKSVLDIACGEGYGSSILARVASSVIGVDSDQDCITHAQKTYARNDRPGLRFVKGNMQNIPISDKSVDAVVSFESLEHVSEIDQRRFISEVSRVLSDDGVLFISTPNTEIYQDSLLTANPFHLHELTLGEFETLLKSQFPSVKVFHQGFEIVSLLLDRTDNNIGSIPLLTWRDAGKMAAGKYYVALASKAPLNEYDIRSVILDTGKSYHDLSQNYWKSNLELEKVGAWATSLEKLRIEQEQTISSFRQALESKFDNPAKDKAESSSLELYELFRVQLSDLRADLGKIVARDTQSTQIIAQQSRLISELENSKNELRNQMETLLSELEQKEKVLQEIKLEEAQHIENLAILRIEVAGLGSRLKESEQENAKWKMELDKLQNANVLAFERIEQLRKSLEMSEGNNAGLQKENQDIKNDFEFLRRQLHDTQNSLSTIHGSDGWKLLNRYYKFKGKYLHEDSWRYKVLKRMFRSNSAKTELSDGATHSPFVDMVDSGEMVDSYLKEPIDIPVFDQIDVSIVIPVYNAFEMNLKCIASVVRNTSGVRYEIILADDASSDQTGEIENYVNNLVISRSESNLGFLRNCNKAAAIARGKYIHFLNNDTEVQSHWLDSLFQLMESDSKIGIAGSKLLYPDGKLQEAGGIIWKDGSGWNFGNRQDPENPEFNYVKDVDYISGASILVKKELWLRVGGFDERYTPAYCEDSDLAFSARELGYRTVYQPLSRVVHYEGYSHGSDQDMKKGVGVKAYQIANNKKFREKWQIVLEKDQLENGVDVFTARDRSFTKKCILFIDHYVPHIDRDAGSKTTFQYLKLFLSMGFNVKFIGDNFYRHEPYTTQLQQLGIEVLYGTTYANQWKQWITENAGKFTFIYLNRPHIAAKYFTFLREHTKAPIIYYGHDLHYLREKRRYELEGSEKLLEESNRWRRLESSLLKEADLSLTPSVEEYKTIKKEFPESNVHLMRPYVFDVKIAARNDFGSRENILFVGGFNHQPNVDAVWWFINQVWPEVKRNDSAIKLLIVGSNPPEELQEVRDDRIILKGFVSDEQLGRLYATSRVVIVPLRYGAGVKGKTVEALSHGVPIVTTSTGIEGLPGDCSFIKPVESEHAFASEVIRIYSNETEWKGFSEKALKYISEEFSERKAIDVLNHALSNIRNR